jgi:hypothetical protein
MKKMKLLLSAFFVLALFTTLTLGQTINVTVAQGLNTAIDYANAGNADTLVLVDDGGIYYCNATTIESPMTIKGRDGAVTQPIIVTKGSIAEQWLRVRANFTLMNLTVDGYDPVATTYDSCRYVIHFSDSAGMADIKAFDVTIKNIYRYGDPQFSTDGTIFNIANNSRAGDVLFERCTFANTGDEALRSINTHKAPVHPTNNCWSSFTVRNCTFINIRGSSMKIENDGDSTTVDNPVLIENVTFYNCYRRVIWEREFSNSIMRNLLITYSITGNDNFGGAGSLVSFEREGSTLANVDSFACVRIVGTDTVRLPDGAYRADAPSSWSFCSKRGTIDSTTLYGIDPQFADPGNWDFTIPTGNALLTLGHDGLGIGDRRWTGQLSGIREIDNGQIPSEFTLSQNYPNPFNPQTKIQFSLSKAGNVSLTVFNVVGEEVAVLVNGFKNSGNYEYTFDPKGLSSGIYFYTLKTSEFVSTKKMILMK